MAIKKVNAMTGADCAEAQEASRDRQLSASGIRGTGSHSRVSATACVSANIRAPNADYALGGYDPGRMLGQRRSPGYGCRLAVGRSKAGSESTSPPWRPLCRPRGLGLRPVPGAVLACYLGSAGPGGFPGLLNSSPRTVPFAQDDLPTVFG